MAAILLKMPFSYQPMTQMYTSTVNLSAGDGFLVMERKFEKAIVT